MLRKLAPCFYAIVIDALGFGLVFPIMATVFESQHSPFLGPDASMATRNFLLGIAYLLYPLFMFFGSSFMGDLSDIWGRKKVLVMCMTGITLSFALMGLGIVSCSLTLLFVGRALSGLMAGSQPIAQASIADLSTPETKAGNIGLISLSYSLATAAGPLIGGVLADRALSPYFTFSTPLWLSALLALLAVIWLLVSFKDTFKPQGHKKISLARPILIFIEAFQHKSVRMLALVYLVMQIGYSIYFQFLIVHMHRVFNYSNWEIGALQCMLGIGFALGILIGIPFFKKRMSTHKTAIITLLLTGIFELLSCFIHLEAAQWVLAILVACFDMIAFAMMITLFSDAVDESKQGWAMGITGSVMAIAWVVSGLGSNILTVISSAGLIGIGGALVIISSVLLMLKKAS